MSDVHDSWGFAEGDPITAELTAVRRLGGGSAYEAYLAFDEITYGPVVVKVVRPGPGRRRARACAACAARSRRWRPSTTRSWSAACATSWRASGRTWCWSRSTGPGCRRWSGATGRCQEQQYLPLGDRDRQRAALPAPARLDPPRRQAQQRHHGRARPADRPVGGAAGRRRRAHARRIGTDAYMSPEQCDPDRYGAPGAGQRRLGPRRHAVRGGRRLPGVRRGRPSTTPLPAADDPPTSCRTGTPDEVAKIVVRRASSPTRPTGRCRTRSPRRSSRCWPGSPPARLGGGLETR